MKRLSLSLIALLVVGAATPLLVGVTPAGSRMWTKGVDRVSAYAADLDLWSPNPGPEAKPGWTKFEGNPVLGGSLGTAFDLALLKEDGRYRMWFSWRPEKSIALTESGDGIHWSEPTVVMGPEAATGWEDDINRPAVIKHRGLYHMWYVGQTRGSSRIGYATSPDGRIWSRSSAQPVLAPTFDWERVALMSPHVLWDEREQAYKMWYAAGEQYEPDVIGYATSRNGAEWSKHSTPVFQPSGDHAWERFKVGGPQVIVRDGWYLLFNIGFRDLDHAAIGLARSRDGIRGWSRHPANPVIAPGKGASWDRDAVYKPFAIPEAGRWSLWHNGRRRDLEQIGLVIHEGDDLGFELVR